jgi:hypothetical protein
MSGSQTIATSDTRIEALKLQSSAFGVTITVAYGLAWLKGNLLWFGGYQAIPHTTETNAGKGGGVKTQHTSYTYTASVMMGLCHGNITGVPRIKRGKKLYDGGAIPEQILTATETFVVPGSPYQVTVAHAANYSAVVSVMLDGVPLSQGWDYSVANGVFTFHPGWVSQTVIITYQYTEGTIDLTALDELDLTFKAGALGQSVWSHLTTNHPTEALGYSGLAYVELRPRHRRASGEPSFRGAGADGLPPGPRRARCRPVARCARHLHQLPVRRRCAVHRCHAGVVRLLRRDQHSRLAGHRGANALA